MRSILFAGALLACCSGRVDAQRPLNAIGTQDLDFGVVFPGVPSSVLRTDRISASRIRITGARRAEVAIQFLLPLDMISPGGDRLPLTFGPDDAGYSTRPAMQSMQGFDPRTPLLANLSRSGRLHLTLGGSVQPATDQAAGIYGGTVTLTLSYTGN